MRMILRTSGMVETNNENMIVLENLRFSYHKTLTHIPLRLNHGLIFQHAL